MIDKYEYLEEFINSARIAEDHSIIVCNQCDGLGFRENTDFTRQREGMYTSVKNKCSTCKGEGRLVEVKLKILSSNNVKNTSYYPITNKEKEEINNLDDK